MALTINAKNGTRLQFISAPGGVAKRKELKIEFVTQQPSENLCWAACSTMIINTLKAKDPNGEKAEICKIASYKLSKKCCLLSKKISKECNQTAFPNPYEESPGIFNYLDVFDHYKLNYNKASCPPSNKKVLDYNEIKDEINNDRPIIALVEWNTTTGTHVVIISGYDDYDESIIILDPLTIPGGINSTLEGSRKYNEFRNGIRSTWLGTYYNFSK